MQSVHISDALIYSTDDSLNQVLSEYLKTKGAANISVHSDLNVAKEALSRFPRAFLIIDWTMGPKKVVPLLSQNLATPTGPLRSIFLIADRVTEDLIATAAEYGVSQIYTDERSIRSIGPRLTALAMTEALPDEVRAGLGSAADLKHNGDPERALRTLKVLLKKFPQNLRLKAEIADLLLRVENFDEALLILDGMERTRPLYVRGVHLRGRTLMRLGKFSEALSLMEQANILNPHDTNRMVEIGQIYLQLDDPGKAEQSFDAALDVDPAARGAAVGKSQCRLMEGDVNQALGMLKDVSGDVEKAGIFNTCAVIHVRKGRLDDALKLYFAALKAIPRAREVQARIHFNVGLAYRRMGRKEEAKEAFEKCLSLDGTFAKARAHLSALGATPPATKPKPEAIPASQGTTGKPKVPFQPKSMDSVFAPIAADNADELDAMLEEDLEKSPFVA